MKIDSEDILDSILDIMVSGGALNTKITEVENEKIAKGKGVAGGLKPIAAGSYYPQTWSDKILNTNPGIFYGIEEAAALDGGGAVAKTYTIFVEIVLVDNGQTNDTHKRIARYTRALEELFTKAFDNGNFPSRVKVAQLRPFAFKVQLDSDEEIKVGGISLTTTLV